MASVGETVSPLDRSETRSRLISVRDWVLTIVIALSVAMAIRGVFIEAFRIPTSSMEKTLLAGDFVLVSKLLYGPRLPTALGLPFLRMYVPGIELPGGRLPGFEEPRRGDVIVFNFPQDDAPVIRKTHYIKRVLGLPGDTLTIVDKVPYVNGNPLPLAEGMQQQWLAVRASSQPFPFERLRALGAEEIVRVGWRAEGVAFRSTEAVAREVEEWSETRSISPFVLSGDAAGKSLIFPEGSGYVRDNYGPLHVPARGDVVPLTKATLPTYREIMERFEGHNVSIDADGKIQVDGRPASTYAVEQNYFFVMGDNRDSSFDSRVWGFVPWDHVVGKATTIYFSWDREERRPRYGRIFSAIE